MLNRKKKRLQKLLMQIVAHTQRAKNVLLTEVAEDLKEIVVGGKQFGIHTEMKDLEKNRGNSRHICLYNEKIQHQLIKDTNTEDPIFSEQRLAFCLYRLGREAAISTQ